MVLETGSRLMLTCKLCPATLISQKWYGPHYEYHSFNLEIERVTEMNSGLYTLQAKFLSGQAYMESVNIFIGGK